MTLPCHAICKRKLKRFHFTCLTCPTRRVLYGKTGKWRRWQRVTLTFEAATGHGFVLPNEARTYAITFPKNISKVRNAMIKILLTVAERIAEW